MSETLALYEKVILEVLQKTRLQLEESELSEDAIRKILELLNKRWRESLQLAGLKISSLPLLSSPVARREKRAPSRNSVYSKHLNISLPLTPMPETPVPLTPINDVMTPSSSFGMISPHLFLTTPLCTPLPSPPLTPNDNPPSIPDKTTRTKRKRTRKVKILKKENKENEESSGDEEEEKKATISKTPTRSRTCEGHKKVNKEEKYDENNEVSELAQQIKVPLTTNLEQDEEEEEETSNVIVGRYEGKISHWKGHLKNKCKITIGPGIMTLDNLDHLFGKGTIAYLDF